MILSGSSISLQAVLAGAITTSQPECHVDYIDYAKDGVPTTPATYRSALNSSTDVSILPAPTFNPTREVLSASIYNKDTVSVTVTVKTDDGTTERIIAKATLLTLETLCYEKGQGWYALDTNGNRKEVTSSVFSSLTVAGTVDVSGISTFANNLRCSNGSIYTYGFASSNSKGVVYFNSAGTQYLYYDSSVFNITSDLAINGKITSTTGGSVGGANSTGSTTGHFSIPTSAGAPTGVPSGLNSGTVAIQYDTTNNKLYVYNGAWKSTATLT